MDLQHYISSGVIESYVFGLLNQEERMEFEQLCATHPELRAARDAFELQLEKQALAQAVEPPAGLRERVLQSIEVSGPGFSDANPPLAPVRSMGWLRAAAVACMVLLLGSSVLNVYFFSRYKLYSARYDQLVASQLQMASANRAMQTRLQDYESALGHIKNPGMIVVKLPGVNSSPASLATVYWDSQSKDVYLMVNQLPRPAASDRQYQLWALVDGKPVDAGVFDIGDGLLKMKNIPRAQAFAITLEKRGGSPSPHLDALYVLGKVSA